MSIYRKQYAPLISKIIKDIGVKDMKKLRKELRDAFPDPPRQYHPYKMWLKEIRHQLGMHNIKHKPVKEQKERLF